jgi:hypothetical protein
MNTIKSGGVQVSARAVRGRAVGAELALHAGESDASCLPMVSVRSVQNMAVRKLHMDNPTI